MPDPAPAPAHRKAVLRLGAVAAQAADDPAQPPLLADLPGGDPRGDLILSFATGGPASRTRVPYQPFFVDQLTANKRQADQLAVDSLEGELKTTAKYDPQGSAKPEDVTHFTAQIRRSSTGLRGVYRSLQHRDGALVRVREEAREAGQTLTKRGQ